MFPIRNIEVSNTEVFIDSLTRDCLSYGSGSFARVYPSPDNQRVYKIIHKTDSAYMKFLHALSEQTEQNPFLPVIYSVTNINYGEYVLVSMEPLERLEEKAKRDKPWLSFFEYEREFNTLLVSEDKLPKNKDALERAIDLVQKIKESDKKIFFDVHPFNIMLRQGHPVMTDVLCCSSDFLQGSGTNSH